MKRNIWISKQKKAKNGEGRKTLVKMIPMPANLVEELKAYKTAYSLKYNQTISWCQMFTHWKENVKKFDPEISKLASELLERWKETKTFDVDPTEGPVWKMKYFLEKDGDEIPFDIVGGLDRLPELLLAGWTLWNDAGVEINPDQAKIISEKIKTHNKK